jgi:hypothetical protein
MVGTQMTYVTCFHKTLYKKGSRNFNKETNQYLRYQINSRKEDQMGNQLIKKRKRKAKMKRKSSRNKIGKNRK